MVSMIDNLFSTPIYKSDCDINVSFYKDFITSIKGDSVSISNRGGWQSGNLVEEYRITPLIEILDIKINEFAKALGSNRKLNVSSLWANINNIGNYNIPHKHPNSFISGVLYLTNSTSGLIIENPNRNIEYHWRLKDFDNPYSHTILNEGWRYEPKEKDCIIFPGWVTHSVEPSKENNRVSIAFNSN